MSRLRASLEKDKPTCSHFPPPRPPPLRDVDLKFFQYYNLGMQLTQFTTICGVAPIRVAPRDCVRLSQLHTQLLQNVAVFARGRATRHWGKMLREQPPAGLPSSRKQALLAGGGGAQGLCALPSHRLRSGL